MCVHVLTCELAKLQGWLQGSSLLGSSCILFRNLPLFLEAVRRQRVLSGLYKAQRTPMQYTKGLLTSLDLSPEYAIMALSQLRHQTGLQVPSTDQ